MFERCGIGVGGAPVHDVGVVDSMTLYARVSNIAESGKFRAIADLVALRVDDQEGRQWWACDGWDAAVAEVGAALSIGKREASGQLSIAVALRFRLPKVAAVFADGGVSARTVGTICWRTRLVEDPNTLAVIDAALAGALSEWAGLSRKKIEKKIDGWVHKFDPAAVIKVRSAARGRGVGVGKPDDQTGVASIWGALLATDAELFDRALTALATQVCDNDPRTFAQRRADAVGVLSVRGDRLVCQCGTPDCPAAGPDARATAVVIHVLTDALPAPVPDPLLSGDPAAPLAPIPAPPEPESAPVEAPAPATVPAAAPVGYMVGGAVVPPVLLADLVARGAKIRTVASASDLETVPSYRPSTAIDEFVRMRAMTCMFPGCDQPATRCDVDHTVPWPGGPTHPGNLGPKCRKHHLLKTFYGGPHGWRDRQQPDGSIVWTAPTGHTYTSVPESRILFPDKNTDTPLPDGAVADVTDLDMPPAAGRAVMMPIRRRTRAQNQAQHIAHERALNNTEIQEAAAAKAEFERQRAERQARETAEAAAAEADLPPPPPPA